MDIVLDTEENDGTLEDGVLDEIADDSVGELEADGVGSLLDVEARVEVEAPLDVEARDAELDRVLERARLEDEDAALQSPKPFWQVSAAQ